MGYLIIFCFGCIIGGWVWSYIDSGYKELEDREAYKQARTEGWDACSRMVRSRGIQMKTDKEFLDELLK